MFVVLRIGAKSCHSQKHVTPKRALKRDLLLSLLDFRLLLSVNFWTLGGDFTISQGVIKCDVSVLDTLPQKIRTDSFLVSLPLHFPQTFSGRVIWQPFALHSTSKTEFCKSCFLVRSYVFYVQALRKSQGLEGLASAIQNCEGCCSYCEPSGLLQHSKSPEPQIYPKFVAMIVFRGSNLGYH